MPSVAATRSSDNSAVGRIANVGQTLWKVTDRLSVSSATAAAAQPAIRRRMRPGAPGEAAPDTAAPTSD